MTDIAAHRWWHTTLYPATRALQHLLHRLQVPIGDMQALLVHVALAPSLVDFKSQYDGKGGRPAAHLVIAWPHGVHVVDAMVEAFNADGNMSVVSLVNAEMHNATAELHCLYATEAKYREQASTHKRKIAWGRIQDKAVCPFPLRLPR